MTFKFHSPMHALESLVKVIKYNTGRAFVGFNPHAMMVHYDSPFVQAVVNTIEDTKNLPFGTGAPSSRECKELAITKTFANGYRWEMRDGGAHRLVSPDGIGGTWSRFEAPAVSYDGRYGMVTEYYGFHRDHVDPEARGDLLHQELFEINYIRAIPVGEDRTGTISDEEAKTFFDEAKKIMGEIE